MAEAVNPGGGSFPGEDYECKICYNYYDLDRHTPKLLGCSHTFCLECLDALHAREGRGWRVVCPVCRHRTPVPEHRVRDLPDDAAVTGALPLEKHECPEDRAAAPATLATARQTSDDGCKTCKQVAFTAGSACAIFCFLSTAVLLLLGLVFVHNFNHTEPPVGPVCLFVASVLALFSLILTWLMCMLKYRPETGASSFSSLSWDT